MAYKKRPRKPFKDWKPDRNAISHQVLRHPLDLGRSSIVVSHPTAPASHPVDTADPDLEPLLRQLGVRYLAALDDGLVGDLGVPSSWIDALENQSFGERKGKKGGRKKTSGKSKKSSSEREAFEWLPIQPPFPVTTKVQEFSPVLSSYRLRRSGQPRDCPGDADEKDQDTTVILVASDILDTGPNAPIHSEFGLRVVMHFREGNDGTRVSITGMTAHLPFGQYRSIAELREEPRLTRSQLDDILNTYGEFLGDEKLREEDPRIAAQLRLRPGVTYQKLRFRLSEDTGDDLPPVLMELSGRGIGDECGDRSVALSEQTQTSYGFVLQVSFHTTDTGTEFITLPLERCALISDANGPGIARVFEQDPASWRDLDDLREPPGRYDWSARRPTRSEEQLDGFREFVRIGGAGPILLETADFTVRNCPGFVKTDPDDDGPKTVELPAVEWPHVRDDDHSAISAYWNCKDMFEAMRSLGLEPEDYFTKTERVVDVFYRSGIRPGPGKDGQTVNARVKLQEEGAAPLLSPDLPKIQMHLALGNLSHRARWVPDDPVPTWAEPLGIATSERWMWHEFGHVLILARLAELEFRFAHSAGDALAAVWADPLSRLADARCNLPDRFRGITFPWVYLTRRHDRCVTNGWSWSGRFHRPVIDAPEDQLKCHKGYLSEQILSSTLFRLYLVLGGDTLDVEDGGPDFDTRMTASRVTLYLIMAGIECFGQPPAKVEELETAMIDADGRLENPLVLDLPSSPPPHEWIGGQAHKVIRWAFEAQGMHPPDPDVDHNAPGLPPPVDLYIKDRRPVEETCDGGTVHHVPGGYVPVSLDWAGDLRWLAESAGSGLQAAAVEIAGVLGNRGQEPAEDIALRAWFGWVTGNPGDRGWDRTARIDWVHQSGFPPPVPAIPGGDEVEFTISETIDVRDAHLLVLLEATCPGDSANSDPSSQLPCAIEQGQAPSRIPRTLADLAANDNNLGLWMFTRT